MANNKKKKSAKAVRLQRVRAIQGSVGVVCLFIIGFVLFWAAKSAFKTISDDSSEAVKTAPAASAAEKDDKSADDTDSKDTDSADDSAKPDSDSSAEEAAAPADSTDDSEASGADEYWNDVADSSEAEGGDTEEVYFRLFDLGCDGFSTDYPSVMFSVIRKLKEGRRE